MSLLPLGLAACGDATAPEAAADTEGGAPADAALVLVSDNAADCGLEMQDRMVWGQAVASSGLEMQEVRADPGLVLRVWSENDAGVTVRDDGGIGVLSGVARGPAWIAAEQSPQGFMLYLPEGAAAVSVSSEDGIRCSRP